MQQGQWKLHRAARFWLIFGRWDACHARKIHNGFKKHYTYITEPVWTLFFIQIYMDALPGVSKNQIILQIKLSSFCARIAPKRHKLRKIVKIEKKCQKNPCFLRVFRILFNLGAILAHQTSNSMFSGSWRIFWYPRDPWGRIHIENIKVLAFVFDISERWRPLQLFSNNSK